MTAYGELLNVVLANMESRVGAKMFNCIAAA